MRLPPVSTKAAVESSFPAMVVPPANHVFPSPVTTHQRSPWRSPVPYLFGGLAAMLGLIAFALLLLACSYWKLSTRSRGGDIESGDKQIDSADKAVINMLEDKIVVIMAGDERPTFLATPVSAKTWISSVKGKTEFTEGKEGEKWEETQISTETEESSREENQ